MGALQEVGGIRRKIKEDVCMRRVKGLLREERGCARAVRGKQLASKKAPEKTQISVDASPWTTLRVRGIGQKKKETMEVDQSRSARVPVANKGRSGEVRT